MEFTCSPVCKVKKRVKVLLQKSEGICFQIPPFVVIRETRGSNRGARGDGSQFGDLSSCQRPVDRPEIVVLVFAHSESPAPVAVRCDPLCTAGRWRRQRQMKVAVARSRCPSRPGLKFLKFFPRWARGRRFLLSLPSGKKACVCGLFV